MGAIFVRFIRSFLAKRGHSKWKPGAPSRGPCRLQQRSKETSRGTRELRPQSMMEPQLGRSLESPLVDCLEPRHGSGLMFARKTLGRSLESPLVDRQKPRHGSRLILTRPTFASSPDFPSSQQIRRLGQKNSVKDFLDHFETRLTKILAFHFASVR